MGDVDRCREQRRAHGHVLGQVLVDHPVEQVDRPDELGHEAVGRLLIDLVRLADLLDPAGIHHRDAGGHGHRFFLVVSDHHAGHARRFDDADQFQLHLRAQLLVQGAHRLVQQQQLRPLGQRPRQRHALLLATGQLVRLALAQVAHLHQFQHLADALADRVLAQAILLQPEGDVLLDRHVREQRIGLEHHVDRPLVRRQCVQALAIEGDAALGGRLEAAQAAPQGRLATAHPAQHHHLVLTHCARSRAGAATGGRAGRDRHPRCAPSLPTTSVQPAAAHSHTDRRHGRSRAPPPPAVPAASRTRPPCRPA
ncbi:hypothetical protein G6F40_013318 [Rhizopus arrhizus]|nr:hypothetical protein G6F40_013318 [Rhizopus arrhizus]